MSKTLELSMALIGLPSLTPEDGGCQQIISDRLQACGFKPESMPFGEVQNLWARRGKESPLLVFAGHTDVVPVGAEDQWTTPPFTPTVIDGILYGRDTADMKSSLAAMVVATENFVKQHPQHKGSIGFLITSDEEGPARDGTLKVVETLENRNEKMDWCLIGEPSCCEKLGDVIKNGRRGSLNGRLTIRGIQGHIAYPHLAANPIHLFCPALGELLNTQWDQGNDHFPPTSFQVSNIHSGTGADNVIPANLDVTFNFRYSTEYTAEQLQNKVKAILDKHDLNYDLTWRTSGNPFLTPGGALIDATVAAIKSVTGLDTELSTAGGTSDGRFIAPLGVQVVELGPLNATIHKVNECVKVSDLDDLQKMYQLILENLLL